MKIKFWLLAFIYLLCCCNLKSQILRFDSLYNDSCLEININLEKTYVICHDRFHNLTRKGYLVNGKEESNWEIYSEGKLFKFGKYKKAKRVGTWREYYVSGKEVFIGKYKNDLQTGKWKVYQSEFDLRDSNHAKTMILTETRRYKKGKLVKKVIIK
ncbi:MAG: hypothetical protein ACXW0J_01880 [Nitrososphaeraceae archaeon]